MYFKVKEVFTILIWYVCFDLVTVSPQEKHLEMGTRMIETCYATSYYRLKFDSPKTKFLQQMMTCLRRPQQENGRSTMQLQV